MSDAAYIQPSEREPGPWGKRFSVHEVEESHAVLDAVAAELADYVRKAPHVPECSIFGPTYSDRLLGVWMESDRKCTCGKEDSLMRYDALHKEAGQ